MNPVFLNIGASIAIGIALSLTNVVRKTPARWLLTLTVFTTAVLAAIYFDLRSALNVMMDSELIIIVLGALVGPAIFFGAGAPFRRVFTRVIAGILAGTLCFGATAFLSHYAFSREDGRTLPEKLEKTIIERATIILEQNLKATIDNTDGTIRILKGNFKDENGKNPAVFVCQNIAETLVKNKCMGPHYRIEMVSTPTPRNLVTAERIINGKPVEVFIANGTAETAFRITPSYIKEGKPTWDKSQIVEQTLSFQAIFTADDDLHLVQLTFSR